MKYVTLLVDDEPESVKLLKNVLQIREFEVIAATSLEEATEKLEQYLPHVLIVDKDLGGGQSGLDWLEKVRSGPFAFIPALVVTSSTAAEDVKKALSLKIDDYILKPADYNLLSKKIFKLCKEMEKNPLYKTKENFVGEGSFTIDGIVTGISETGMCVASQLIAAKPLENVEYITHLFDSINVKRPMLRLMNTGSENVKKAGFSFREYFQFLGWSENDRKKVRQWIKDNKLRVIS